MPEMHLRQPRFTSSACRPFTKKHKNGKIKKRGNSGYIYQNELDKACFQHEEVYGDFKNLTARTASDKKLCDRTSNVARTIASMIYRFFDKKFFLWRN